MSQQLIITLIIAYTCVSLFAFTAVVTALSMIGVVKFRHESQQKKLFAVLIVEVIAICLGGFTNVLRFDVGAAAKTIEARGRQNMAPAAAVLFREGIAAFASNPALAESKFEQAASLDPDSFKIHLNLGVVRLQLEKYPSALVELKAANALFEQLPKPDQPFDERIVIASSLVGGYSRNKDFAGVQATIDSLPINDTGDSLCALYVNAADGMFQASDWTEAADYARRARMIATAFRLYERELTGANTEANALYHLPGPTTQTVALLSDMLQKAATYPIDGTVREIAEGYLHNTRGLFEARDPSSAAQAAAVADFTAAIERLTPLVQRRDDCKVTLASAYGNRADAYARAGRTAEAASDRASAINYFIQRGWRQGVSAQLSEIARGLLGDGTRARDAFAAATAALKLGGDKPAADRQDDNELLAAATSRLSEGERAAVQSSLSADLERATKVPAAVWKTSFGLP